MDENEARALGQGLAEGLGSALAGALDATIGATAIEQARKEQQEQERQEELADTRDKALQSCRYRWKMQRQKVVELATGGVSDYCRSLQQCISFAAERSGLVPADLNYLERYNALHKTADRKVLLSRIEKTISEAEAIVDKVPLYDPPTFFADCAQRFRESMVLMENVKVGEPASGKETEEAKQRASALADALAGGNKAALDNYSNALESLLSQVDKLFDKQLKDNPLSEHFAGKDNDDKFKELEEFEDLLDKIAADADEQLAASCAASARAVAGMTVPLDDLPKFEGKVTCELRFDPDAVAEIAKEVRKAFAKYQHVVMDNGVYAAFSDGSDFGKCRERYAWRVVTWLFGDDCCDSYRSNVDGIASTIEEDDIEGGDSPTRCLEKLQKANAKRYMGILDDDFSIHVDAFWYGFRKLMEFSTGLLDVDTKEFQAYVTALEEAAKIRTKAIAALMDEQQATDFANRVSKLEKTPWADVIPVEGVE